MSNHSNKDFKIIIIDDDEKIIKVLKIKLGNYQVVGYTDAALGLQKIKEEKYDLVILDYLLVNISAEEVITRIREIDKGLFIFLLTGCDKNMLKPLHSIQEMDIQFYCAKSANVENILLNIENAIKSIGFMKSQKCNLSIRLKELRKLKGVGQDDLAKYVGVGRTAVANWESGLTEPTADTLRKIATYFRVSIDYLVCHEIV